MAAGLATLEAIDSPGFYDTLSERTQQLATGLAERAAKHGVALQTAALGGMFGFVFTDEGPVHSYEQVAGADVERFQRFFHAMLDRNVYVAPSAFEAGFVSAAHGAEEIDATLDAADASLGTLKND